jgi:imidazolonepropionase-like amidohydrolase
MRINKTWSPVWAVMALILAVSVAVAQDAEPTRVLFTNVNIFDGNSESLQNGMNVLVEDNLISQISSSPISASGATVIDGDGRTLMPGLVDLHSHLLASGDGGLVDIEANFTWEDLALRMAGMARLWLMDGFTTVRDMGGACGGLRRQIDAGIIVGPRVYPSCAWIGPPGGHSDMRSFTMPQTPMVSQVERLGITANVNGADDVTAVAPVATQRAE